MNEKHNETEQRLKTGVGMTVATLLLLIALATMGSGCSTTSSHIAATTREEQSAMTPAKALQRLVEGNARFASGRSLQRNWSAQRKQTATGQYPFALILSCIDSRTSSEIIFDQGLGDLFNARIAGNIVNEDILGSMEFACKVAGARLIVVVGHSSCGAVKGACSGATLGNLTGLLQHIRPAVEQARSTLPASVPTDPAFVEKVALLNVEHVIQQIRERSVVLKQMIDAGEIQVVGGIHDLSSGTVQFLHPISHAN